MNNLNIKKHQFQKGPGTHPASSSIGAKVYFIRDKWPERDVNHSSPCGVEFKNEWRYTSTPMCLDGVDRETFTFTFGLIKMQLNAVEFYIN